MVPPDTNDPQVEEVASLDLTRIYERLRGLGRSPKPAAAPGRVELVAKNITLTSEINRWVMVPDKQVTWYWAALKRGRELLRQQKFSAIYASLESFFSKRRGRFV